MIAKILSSSTSFEGVNYNTDKIDKNKGELMSVKNFGPLQGLENLRPSDYINYLKLISAQNKRITAPQFHATISCKGRETGKEQLTEIALKWLEEMGYAKNPFLIIFHKDTLNNHVHIVSTRIDKEGKKISSAFENIRAVQNINKVLGFDEILQAKSDIEKALTYKFSTIAQFMMILESSGYFIGQNEGNIALVKFGKKLVSLDLGCLNYKVVKFEKDTKRVAQLRAIFEKYKVVYNPKIYPTTISKAGAIKLNIHGYTSEFTKFVNEKFGIEMLYHGKPGKIPYGYTIIDHAGKNVFKGGEVFPLKEFLKGSDQNGYDEIIKKSEAVNLLESKILNKTTDDQLNYYATFLKAALYNYPTLLQGLNAQGLQLTQKLGVILLNDFTANFQMPVRDILGLEDYKYLKDNYQPEYSNESTSLNEISLQLINQTYTSDYHNDLNPVIDINIVDDIDDEQIHGRNRKRQGKARTNTR
ncbi:MAG: hypothetical protein EON51_02180 [Acinetobacter sp.]|nr:MAG: hypothetical protein EON51_02180 [Acinetobacter sp.]